MLLGHVGHDWPLKKHCVISTYSAFHVLHSCFHVHSILFTRGSQWTVQKCADRWRTLPPTDRPAQPFPIFAVHARDNRGFLNFITDEKVAVCNRTKSLFECQKWTKGHRRPHVTIKRKLAFYLPEPQSIDWSFWLCVDLGVTDDWVSDDTPNKRIDLSRNSI